MARVKRYLDIDVVTAARERMRHVFDLFDSIVVMFSGGKDSLCCLELAREVAEERGALPLDVCFRDEELIPADVIATVEHYRAQPWVRMLYLAVPLQSKKYVLGKSTGYVQWDPGRRHVRPMPEHAYRLPPGDTRTFDQHAMDAFTAGFYKGNCAFVTGIRADESLMRFRGVVNKLSENYITKPTAAIGGGVPMPANVRLCKPIYDWSERDVFKFIGERGLRYARTYERQLYAGQAMRVSTPIHAEQSKNFHLLRLVDPQLYAQVIDVFPEMLAHERYFRDLDRGATIDAYAEGGLDAVEQFIRDQFDPAEQPKALAALDDVRPRAAVDPEAYPTRHILRAFVNGTYKRKILPLGVAARGRE